MSIKYETYASLNLVSDTLAGVVSVTYKKGDQDCKLVTLRQGRFEITLDAEQLRKLAVYSDEIIEDIS